MLGACKRQLLFSMSDTSPPPKPPSPSLLDRALYWAFVVSACALCFIAGVTANHFQMQSSIAITNALEGGKAYVKEFKEKRLNLVPEPTAEMRRQQHEDKMQALFANAQTEQLGDAFNGYTLVSTDQSTTVWLVDMQGKVMHQWNMPFSKAWPRATHVNAPMRRRIFVRTAYAYPNGDLLAQYEGVGDTPYGYGLLKMDKDSKLLWTYDQNAHDDFFVDEADGDIYVLTQKVHKAIIVGLEELSYPLVTDYIVRLTPDGQEISTTSIAKALKNSTFSSLLNPAFIRGEKWDHLHSTSIQKVSPAVAALNPALKAGQMLVSLRNLNSLAIVDLKRNTVVWAQMGPWKQQYAARFLPNGNILAFDNLGLKAKEKYLSRLLEMSPQSTKIIWSYTESENPQFFTRLGGRVQTLPGGNILVTLAERARVQEMTRAGNIVWRYTLPRRLKDDSADYPYAAIMNAHRFAADYFTFLPAREEVSKPAATPAEKPSQSTNKKVQTP